MFPPEPFGGLDVRPACNAFVQILCSAYNVDVSAAIIILTLSTLHGRRVFDVHLFSVPPGQKQLSAEEKGCALTYKAVLSILNLCRF